MIGITPGDAEIEAALEFTILGSVALKSGKNMVGTVVREFALFF